MLLDLTRLQSRISDELEYHNSIILDEALYKDTDIRSLSPIDVDIIIARSSDSSYNMDLRIKGTMVLPCSLTLKDVNYPFDIKTEVIVSNDDENYDEYVKINQNNIDIIPIIWQNILLEIPLRVESEDVSDSIVSGEGWKLIREN